MKKHYLLLSLLCASFLGFSQEFTIDFEGTDPLSNLPTGVTSVDPTGNAVAFVGANVNFIETAGGDIVLQDVGAVEDRAQFSNSIFTEGSNNLLQTDYTGHIIINETALGAESFTLRLNFMVFGHGMSGTDCGIFTIVGNDSGTWKSDRITSRNGGFATGLGLSAGGANGFQYGTVEPPYRDVVLTYNATDMLYRLYIEGVLISTSDAAQGSGEWDARKLYIGFNGKNSVGSGDGIDHLDSATGEFTANGVRNDGRNADLQTRMDNIQVYQRAITDDDVLTLFNGGTLSVHSQTQEKAFNAYPNPVQDRLYFSSKNIASVEIYNLLGSRVSTQNVNDGVEMSSLSKGVYLIRCQNKEGVNIATVKAIKK